MGSLQDQDSMSRLLDRESERLNNRSLFEKITESPYWNIVLLALAWSWTLTTSTLLTTIGPLSAKKLGANDSLAAFTIGVFLLGAAFSSVPSAFLFKRFGRFWGFSMGCFAQVSGSILGVGAMRFNSQPLLFMGCFCVGLGQGLGQFYRFAAVETCPVHLKSRAVTYVLSGGVIAAFLGPTSANETVDFAGREYMGSFATMAIIGILNELTIMLVNFPKRVQLDQSSTDKEDSRQLAERLINVATRRTVWEIISQPLFIVSCAVATLAHTIMVMLMSNVTLAMKSHDYSFSACSLVMELHFFAMFSPGFFTGMLIKKHGTFIVALLGGFIFAGAIIVLAVDTQTWNYVVGMILLGAGWNFSFSSGTVMLTSSYKPNEATDVQAVNDVILFTVAGAGSLLSGALFSMGGWLLLIYVSSGLAVLNLGLFVLAWGLRSALEQAEEEEKAALLGSETDTDAEVAANTAVNGGSLTVSSGNDLSAGQFRFPAIGSSPGNSRGGMSNGLPTVDEDGCRINYDSLSLMGGSPQQHQTYPDYTPVPTGSQAYRSASGSGSFSGDGIRLRSGEGKRTTSFSFPTANLFRPEGEGVHEDSVAIRTMSVS